MKLVTELRSKGLRGVRNYDADYITEDGTKRYGVNLENECGDVLDYEYFSTEKKAEKFVKELNK